MMTLSLRSFAALLALSAVGVAQNPLQTIRGTQPGEDFGIAVRPFPDADGDGVLDLAARHARGVRIVSSTSGATLREIQHARGIIGDVNADGWPDFWTPVSDPVTGNLTHTAVLSGLDGALLAEWPWMWGNEGIYDIDVWREPVALDDVNGDGIDDFVRHEVHDTGPGFAHFLAVVSGADASELHTHPTGSPDLYYAVLNDVDGDGVRDLYLGQGSGGPRVISGASGATLATPPPTIAIAWVYTVDDVDGDGVDDLALLDALLNPPIFSTQIVSTMTSAVLGTLPGVARPSYDTRAACGDFDGDGQLDVVMVNFDQDRLDVYTVATGALVSSVQGLAGGVLPAPDSNANGREELWLGLAAAQTSTGKLVRIEGSYSEAVGTAFAFGDGSSGPCPCAPGSATTGCGNSLGGGARLAAWGSNSVLERDLGFRVTGVRLSPAVFNKASLIASANAAAIPTPFSGGLLALAAPVQRIANSRFGIGRWFHYFDAPSLDVWSTWAPAQTVHFQVWYRQLLPSSACGLTSNLTNALSITFTP